MLKKNLLITTALPYANGPLHLGHIIEQIQADIWVRFQKMQGHQCIFISGDDSHGTAIMLKAKKENIKTETMIQAIHAQHQKDAKDYAIDFDIYDTTHSKENRALANHFYKQLEANGDISQLFIEQAYDEQAALFLPDRFIRGTCPYCKTQDQYGDNCEACGATYAPTDLIDPTSSLTGIAPIYKKSLHYFFSLEHYHAPLKKWLSECQLQRGIDHQLQTWFKDGLKSWNISRDAPYFGFEIPGVVKKYFYVWMDAPLGYIAAFKKLTDQNPELFETYWGQDSQAELVHFIGKDIIYFHALFWPAMLIGCKLRTPSRIQAHGFLTINENKMSKSRGNFITARQALDHLPAEYWRYYFASKLTSGVEDINLKPDDLIQRINSELIGKVINIASRCAGFIRKGFNNRLADHLSHPKLFDELAEAAPFIANHYAEGNYQQAIKRIMQLADLVNAFIDNQKPWSLAKMNIKDPVILETTTMGVNLFRQLIIYLKPILPNVAKESEAFLNITPMTWQDSQKPLLSHTIHRFKPLMQRVEPDSISPLFH